MVRAWHGRGMTSVNQTLPHCVNQMGKTQSKPLAARHGRGTAWARHAMRESALILSVVLYGCENQSLTWKKEGRLRIFEKNCLKQTSGHTSEKVKGSYRKIHNKELRDIYHTFLAKYHFRDEIENKTVGWCSMYGRWVEGYGGKLKEKRQLARRKVRWDHNIK
jgi:hypothetical protein